MSPRARTVLVAIALCGATSAAHADTVQECAAAAERGQRQREGGALRSARREFLACTIPACPSLIRTDCAAWLADVEQRMPGVVVRATDEAGQDLTDVRVFVDGSLEQQKLDGRRLLVDPGARQIRVERAGYEPVTTRVVAREGEKARLVDVAFSQPTRTQTQAQAFPVLPAVLAGVGVLGVVGFVYFAADGSSDVDRLRSTCAPRCAESDVDDARRKILVANVSLGVGLAALGAATWLFLSAPSSPSRVGVGFRPGVAGGEAVVGGAF